MNLKSWNVRHVILSAGVLTCAGLLAFQLAGSARGEVAEGVQPVAVEGGGGCSRAAQTAAAAGGGCSYSEVETAPVAVRTDGGCCPFVSASVAAKASPDACSSSTPVSVRSGGGCCPAAKGARPVAVNTQEGCCSSDCEMPGGEACLSPCAQGCCAASGQDTASK